MRKIITSIIIISLMFGFNDVRAKEKEVNYKLLVSNAFRVQVALSEKERSLKDVKKLLNVYFTKHFTELFIKENLIKTEHGYQTFGSDFPLYYIPFFCYNEKTKVKKLKNNIYVYENFSDKGAGPVVYKSKYQGVRLIKQSNHWKIDAIIDYVPYQVIHLSKQNDEHKTNKLQQLSSFYSLHLSLLLFQQI